MRKCAALLPCLLWVWAQLHASVVADVSVYDVVTTAVVDAEIRATQEHVELLKSKALLLQRMIVAQQDLVTQYEAHAPNNLDSTKRRSLHRPPRSHERFDDWFAALPPWLPSTSRSVGAATVVVSPSSVHSELLSFRPSGSIGGKKNHHAARFDADDPMRPMLQFLMVLDKQSGAMDLFHPSTKALVWQQRLEIPAPITRVHFHSDRGAHLVLLTADGDLLLYNIRIFHGRRLVAGEYRRFSGLERMWCKYDVQLPFENRGVRGVSPAWHPLDPSFARDAFASQRTLSPAGLHTHLDVELAFVTKPPTPPSVATTVVSYQALHVVTGDHNGELAFFHGQNGSLIGTITTKLGPIGHLKSVSSGVVAFTVTNRVHFADAYDRRLLDVTCEGSRYNITSLDRDLWRHSALYVGTSDGFGLAFRVNRFSFIKRTMAMGADVEGLVDSEQATATCSLTALLRPRASALSNGVLRSATVHQPAIVMALPGYVLLSSGDGHLVLYEASSSNTGAPSYLAEKPFTALESSRSSRIISVDGVSDLHGGGAAAVALTVWEPEYSRFRVELLASRLPPQSSVFEVGWIRAPMMLLCAVGVMFWQQNKVHRSASSSLAPLDMDLPAMRNHRKGHNSGSDWPKSANHRMRGGF